MRDKLSSFWSEDAGQTITELAIIIALVSLALVLVLIVLREEIGAAFNTIRGELQTNGTPQQVPAN